jgi:cytochrome c-type biogenesis protein CcmH
VRLAPERADLWSMLGQTLTLEAGGKVTSDAQAAFREVLKRQPGDQTARFYLAQAKVDAGKGEEAAADFRAILAELPPDDERRGAVEASIARAEGRSVPAADPGQMAMIKGMVASLAAKLKANPDDSDGWVRLVRAYAVLGDTKSRDEAYASARARYDGKKDVLEQLDVARRAEPMR